MSPRLTLSNWLVFVASFLIYTVALVNGFPNGPSTERDSGFPWSPKNSEDGVEFRSFFPESTELEDESDDSMIFELENMLQNDDEAPIEANLMAFNKRSPNSQQDRYYKNKLGYYIVEGANHQIMGTTNLSECDQNGVFISGKENGIPFIQNKKSKYYLAITSSGQVYMTPQQNADTVIRSRPVTDETSDLLLYRIAKTPTTTRYYLDISPASTAKKGSYGPDSGVFRFRVGNRCS